MIEFETEVQLAESVDLNVLIVGEHSTDAADVAQSVHDRSRRRNAPFITISCTELSDARLEVELRAGADRARGGTLLLENVDELSEGGQAVLLKVIQTAHFGRSGVSPDGVDVRLMATATQPLFERVSAGSFLPDLYYLLNTIYLAVAQALQGRNSTSQLVLASTRCAAIDADA